MDWDSIVGKGAGYGLDSCQIVVEVRFSTLIQTGPGAQPASYWMGTGSPSQE